MPAIIVMLAIIEINGGSRTWLHALGGVLVVARIIHPFGLHVDRMMTWQRMVGTVGTFMVMAAAIGTLLWQHFRL